MLLTIFYRYCTDAKFGSGSLRMVAQNDFVKRHFYAQRNEVCYMGVQMTFRKNKDFCLKPKTKQLKHWQNASTCRLTQCA